MGTHDFSNKAREVFDILWQSKDGVMPVSQIRVAHGGKEHEVEVALSELFQGFALFEMFRFDSEDRLVRVAGLLKEIRQFRGNSGGGKKKKSSLNPSRAMQSIFNAVAWNSLTRFASCSLLLLHVQYDYVVMGIYSRRITVACPRCVPKMKSLR